MAHRFETYIAGSIMLLIGLLLVALLIGIMGSGLIPAFFLIGIGIIFSAMALLKSRAPVQYEMSARTTLTYGLIAAIIGVLWVSVSVQTTLAGYVLAVLLIFFGLLFLAYTRVKSASA
jgi:hypothetical protein